RASAAQARAQTSRGDRAEGLRLPAPALVVARGTTFRPLVAEVRLVEAELRQPAAAETALPAAAVAAQAAGQRELAARAWLLPARTVGASRARTEEALRWARYAEATLERSGDRLLSADL